MSIGGILKALGPRVIGAAVTGVAGWIYAKTKGAVVVDPGMAVEMIVGGLVTYAASHRAASAIVNPGDAATGRIAGAIDDAANNPHTSDVVRIPPKF